MVKYNFSIAVLMLSCTSINCVAQKAKPAADLVHLKYTLKEAPEWTSLFVRTSGWFGGDGIFALPADGARNKNPKSTSKNMLIFSDSMVGEIKNGVLQPGSKAVHNTVAYLQGNQPKNENIKFYWNTNNKGEPESFFIPKTPSSTAKDYYWLGDGFVNIALGNTYIFAYRMRNMDTKDDWSFKEMGTSLIILLKGSKPPFKDQRQIETPLHYYDKTSHSMGGFGSSIFVNTKGSGAPSPDGYIYIYGVKGAQNLVVSRALPEDFENFSAWRFWDGKIWNKDKEKVAYLVTNVANELSVSTLPDGRYVVVYQVGGLGPTVALRLGASPVGPFGPMIKLYNAKTAGKKFITYNAKVHPSLSAPGELLISYNQNAYDFNNQLKLFPNLYHPFFLKLKLN